MLKFILVLSSSYDWPFRCSFNKVQYSSMNLKRFILPFVPPVYCNWKAWKTCSNSWEFWVLSRWWNTRIQAPRIQNPGRFRRFNVVQTSWPWGQHFFSIVQTSRSRGQHLCSKFTKIPHVGCAQTFKEPTSSLGPPLRHNTDSSIS